MKELESQLMVERKLARQHVDTKIAEQQMKDEQNGRAPLGALKIVRDEAGDKENIPENVDQPCIVAARKAATRRESLIPFPICDSPRVAAKRCAAVQRKPKSKSPKLQKRVRVSIGRLAYRSRPQPKGPTQKDKERGWNIGRS